MKRIWILVLTLILTLCLCACNQPTAEEGPAAPVAYTFPEGSAVLGVSIAGMNRSSAWAAMEKAVAAHTMVLSVDGVETTVNAQDIDLTCSKERFDAIADAIEAGADVEYSGLIGFNEGKLRALVNENFNKSVTEAALSYDEAAGSFVLIPDAIGQISNPNALVDALRTSIVSLESQQSLTEVSQIIQPTILDEDEAVTQALDKVNAMNTVALTYTFTAEDKTSTHEIPADVIRSFISLGADGVTPDINYNALESYVAELSETYSASSTQGNFRTTGGGTVGLTVSYNGVYVDQEELVADIATCILEGTSGTRTAPFQSAGIRDMPYGGTYIEVNLDAQKLWFYKYGECILSSNLVSGKVSAEWFTPNGVFSIYAKDASTYLVGEDYRTFVNYWMPFYGGYGLHDATWRGSFGGEIYVYGGSHGCVNLPLSSAATIYNNAPVGTKVIVYGGRRSAPPQAQSLGGTTSYSVADDVGTITLNISPRYGSPTMSYSSSNNSVASVSGGVVTIHGVGSATITVSVPASGGYTSATTSVSISVHSACDDGRHKMGDPVTVTPATCQPGLQTTTCSKCGTTESKDIAPVASHKFTTYTQTLAPTCKPGKESSTCDTCGKVTTEREIPANGNHSEGSGEVTTAPGCETPGVCSYKCSICGQTLRTEPIVPTGHNMAWSTILAPTCTNPGLKQEVCQNSGCSETGQTAEIPATGHSMQWYTMEAASCTKTGIENQKCTVCGTEGDTRVTDKLSHSFTNGACTVCGERDPNYVPPTEATTTPAEASE